MSVEQRPMRMTSAPRLVAPSASAAAIGSEEGRMSWPIASEPAPVSSMKARPIRCARSSSSCSGYRPRTSQALNTWSRSAGTGRLLAWEALGRTAATADGRGVHGDTRRALYSLVGAPLPCTEHPSRIYRCSVRHDRGGPWMARSRHARRPPRPRLTLPEVQPPGTGETTFMRLVEAAVASIPPEFRRRLDNVEFVVEEIPRGDEVPGEGIPLGLYQGVPLTERGSGYYGTLPDRIVIFRRPIEARARSDAALASLVREVVLHEVAHYFGIDDDRLDELGW